MSQQRFHLAAEVLIPRAGFLKHCIPAALLRFQSFVEDALDFSPTFRFHLLCHSFHEEAENKSLIVLAKAFDQHEVSFHAAGGSEHQSVAVGG
jgi:hypothetical protein